jgi:hypothetical protein
MELAKTNTIQEIISKISNLPTKVEDIKFGLSISEMNINEVKLLILAIAQKYLSKNVKGKSLQESGQIDLIVEYITTDCKNLQIEEINIIFKFGVLGRYGTIYNDISIDTICGIEGWIESYYKLDRAKRSEGDYIEPLSKEPAKGNEKFYTHAQYLKRNPEERKKYRLKELTAKAKLLKCGYPELKLMLKYTGRGEDVFEALKNKIDASYEVRDIKSVSKIHFVANEIKKLLK